MAVVRQSALVLKVGVAYTEYLVHEACIEIAIRSTTVYKVGVAPTKYRDRAHEACIEVARITSHL